MTEMNNTDDGLVSIQANKSPAEVESASSELQERALISTDATAVDQLPPSNAGNKPQYSTPISGRENTSLGQ